MYFFHLKTYFKLKSVIPLNSQDFISLLMEILDEVKIDSEQTVNRKI